MDKNIVHAILLLTVLCGFFAGQAKNLKAVVQRGVFGTLLISTVYFALLMWAHSLVPPRIQ